MHIFLWVFRKVPGRSQNHFSQSEGPPLPAALIPLMMQTENIVEQTQVNTLSAIEMPVRL